jgi:hypothetical protein
MTDLSGADRAEIVFQEHCHTLRDSLEKVLTDAYGDVWLDRSEDNGRFKVAVTTRCDSSVLARAEQRIRDSPIGDRVDLVRVVWSAQELTAAGERLTETLFSTTQSVTTMYSSPELNSLMVWVTSRCDQSDLEKLSEAIRGAGVPVRVEVRDGQWSTN